MNTELQVVRGGEVAKPMDLSELQRLGGLLSASGYFADAREMAQAAVKVMAGRELGLPPIASMMGLNIIKGKVALSGNLIATCIRRHGYNYRHKQFDTKGCVLEFIGKNGEVMGESSFTEEDATKAGIFSDMYRKFPRNMYFSRAISNGAKWYTPEVFGGAPVYTPEELGARVDGDGNVEAHGVEDQPSPQRNTPAQQAELAQARIAEETAKAKAPAVSPEVEALWARMTDKFEALKVFRELKTWLIELKGEDGEKLYYDILKAHGAEKADGFKNRGDAKKAARDLFEIIERLQAAQPVVEEEEPVNAN